MAVSGQQLLTNLILKTNSPASANITPTKANTFFQEALFNLIDRKYESLQGTKAYDELMQFIKLGQIFTPDITLNSDQTYNNFLYLGTNYGIPNIPDYLHLYTTKAKFQQRLPFTITGASNNPGQPIVITLKGQNNIRTSDYSVPYTEQYVISGITGNTNANGTFYVLKINTRQFQLFSDINLQNPVIGNGIYGINSKPLLSKVFYRVANDYISVEKGGLMSYPGFTYPSYTFGNKGIAFKPDFCPCMEVSVDYQSNNVVLIDTNTTTDYSLSYTIKTLQVLNTMAALQYGQSVRDEALIQLMETELKQFP